MSVQTFLDGRVVLHGGDCRAVLATLADNSIDSIVTDPPYALVSIVKRFGKPGSAPATGNDAYARASAGFMGKQWDTGEAAFAVEFWAQCLRVLKPGGHVAAFSGTRTYHRLAVSIEDAGFEIRDQLAWTYGTGFPKSHDVAKAIDKVAGLAGQVIATGAPVKRMIPGADQHKSGWEKTSGREYQPGDYAADEAAEWQGWGTALKPAWEPIVLARKPLEGTVAANVLKWGTGAINVDGCRSDPSGESRVRVGEASQGRRYSRNGSTDFAATPGIRGGALGGRFPANVIHDGSDEVLAGFPDTTSGTFSGKRNEPKTKGVYGSFDLRDERGHVGDSGSAARFFYSAKAGATDRIGSKHPTVKPVDLMQWLCRLITPPGGTILDPFSGTGTTGEAAWREGFSAVLVERESEYQADIAERMRLCLSGPGEKARAIAKRKAPDVDAGPLFGGADTPPVTAGGSTDSLPTKTAGARVENS